MSRLWIKQVEERGKEGTGSLIRKDGQGMGGGGGSGAFGSLIACGVRGRDLEEKERG